MSNTDGLDLDFSAHELIADMVCQCYYAGNKLRYQMKLRKLRQYQSERSTTVHTSSYPVCAIRVPFDFHTDGDPLSIRIRRPGPCIFDALDRVNPNHHCGVNRQR